MAERGVGHLRTDVIERFVSSLRVIDARTRVAVCRDSDDDKFIGCAVDAKASCVVTGDKDLLSLRRYGEVRFLTAAEFCEGLAL